MDVLPDDVMMHMFQFVGVEHFAFVAGTNQQLYRSYRNFVSTTTDHDEGGDETTEEEEEKAVSESFSYTSMKSVIESISRCQFYLSEGCCGVVDTSTVGHENDDVIIPGLSWLIFSDHKHHEEEQDNDENSTVLITTLPQRQLKLIKLARAAIRYGKLQVLHFALEELEPQLLQNTSSRWFLNNYAIQQGKKYHNHQQSSSNNASPISTTTITTTRNVADPSNQTRSVVASMAA